MSPMTARAVSMALVGGITAPLFLAGGLLEWAAFVAWAGFLAAGGDGAALRKTIPAYVFGAFLAWAAMMLRSQVDVSAADWLWIPRAGIAAALALFILGMATKAEALTYLPAGLIGFASVFGALTLPTSVNVTKEMMGPSLVERLTSLQMYNPFLQAAVSLIVGSLLGAVAGKLEGAMSKK